MRRQGGVGLLEVVVVLAISLALLFVVVPWGRAFWGENAVQTRVNELLHAITYAQMKSEELGEPVVLGQITPGDWSGGMRLFVDKNSSHTYEKGQKLLAVWNWKRKKSPFVDWEGFLSDNYLLFSSHITQSILNGRFIVSYHKGDRSTEIVVNALGRARVERH